MKALRFAMRSLQRLISAHGAAVLFFATALFTVPCRAQTGPAFSVKADIKKIQADIEALRGLEYTAGVNVEQVSE